MDILKRKAELLQEHDDFCATNTAFAGGRDRHINIIVEKEMEIEKLKLECHNQSIKLDDLNACSADNLCQCKDCRIERLISERSRHKSQVDALALELRVLQLGIGVQKSVDCYSDDGCSCPDCIISGHMKTITSLKLQLCGVQSERDNHMKAINQQVERHEEVLVKYNKMHEMLENIHGVFGADWEEFAT